MFPKEILQNSNEASNLLLLSEIAARQSNCLSNFVTAAIYSQTVILAALRAAHGRGIHEHILLYKNNQNESFMSNLFKHNRLDIINVLFNSDLSKNPELSAFRLCAIKHANQWIDSALSTKNSHLIRGLLMEGADLTSVCLFTPEHIEQHPWMVKHLAEHLLLLVKRNARPLIKALLNHPAARGRLDLNKRERRTLKDIFMILADDVQPLELELALLLVEKTPSIDLMIQKDAIGKTILIYIIQSTMKDDDKLKVVEKLVEKAPQLLFINPNKNTVLEYAKGEKGEKAWRKKNHSPAVREFIESAMAKQKESTTKIAVNLYKHPTDQAAAQGQDSNKRQRMDPVASLNNNIQ